MKTSTRFASVDALRGWIMALMAIDHANAFIARQHANEFWNGAIAIYTSALPFLTRLVTHLCAPGFFFLMGAGIYWFSESRREAGWTQAQIMRRTAVRGLTLLLCGQIFESIVIYMQAQLSKPEIQLTKMPMALPMDGSQPYFGFITLSALGVVMACCALLLRFGPVVWLLTSAISTVLTHALLPASGEAGPAWFAVLLAPGISQHVIAVYPVIPWLAVSAAGMYFGYFWRQYPLFRDRVWVLGLAMVCLALALRSFGGWGNITLPRDSSWIEFFNNVKYPPSFVFWTLAVGTNLLVLAALMRLPAWITSSRSPLMVFGQSPLFFYIVHFFILDAFALAFFRKAASLETACFMVLVVLCVLYPLCSWYRTFKMQKPAESLWRMF